MSDIYAALASAIYLAKRGLSGVTEDDERLRASGLYEDWAAGAYQVGDIRNAKGQTCWSSLPGETPETARPWVAPQGAHDMYKAGEYMVYTDGKTYKCLSDTNFSPEDYPQAWEAAEA